MENKDNQKEQRKFYIALYSTVAVIAVTAFIVSFNNKDSEPEEKNNIVANDMTEGGMAAEPVNKSNVKSYKEMTTQATTEAEVKTEATTQNNSSTKKSTTASVKAEPEYTLFDYDSEMVWPVDGQILMDYSVETAVYDKTLEQYRTNDNICISAHIGDSVIAAFDGVVEQILKDNENGNMVVVNHGNGWLTTYGQLDNITVAEGQVVKQGSVLGCVAQPTKYNVALGAHLEFKVSRNNETMDPKLVLVQVDE